MSNAKNLLVVLVDIHIVRTNLQILSTVPTSDRNLGWHERVKQLHERVEDLVEQAKDWSSE